MKLVNAYSEARRLSNLNQDRFYITATEGGFNFIASRTLAEETTPDGVIAYTWYRTRSKDSNKWTIQKVK